MPAASADYELLDFGDGRKLERFGTIVLDRPCPAAAGVARARPNLWRDAVARYEASRVGDGDWSPAPQKWMLADWRFQHPGNSGFCLELGALPSGQVGVFPEQHENWNWIAGQCQKFATDPVRVLNLFAYTGASTLSAAAGGAEVTHIDAAKSVVDRARQNAALSNLAEKPVRWIVEDALKFARRELKRGNHYDALILDPPTYGHGPAGEAWKIERDLLPLLKVCGELTAERRAFVLLTCHTPGIGPAELGAYLSEGIFDNCGQPPKTGQLCLTTADGRNLPSGVFARWPNTK